MAADAAADAFFLPRADGQRLCLFHAARGPARAAVLYVHPFADEMNKCRRMAALQARALADDGCAVLQIDLAGCGDSSGDFGDASWQDWIDDIAAAAEWLRARCAVPLWLWGLRAGCLLAAAAAPRVQPAGLLFWHPVVQGKLQLQQFLRLKAAGHLLEGGAKQVMDTLRRELAGGSTVSVAGYRLSPALAQGLEQATIARPPQVPAGLRLEWLELSTRDDATLSPVSQAALAAWAAAGWRTRSALVTGPSFWQTVEIEDAPALLPATLQAIAPATEAVAA
jgi:uncharacterized protein